MFKSNFKKILFLALVLTLFFSSCSRTPPPAPGGKTQPDDTPVTAKPATDEGSGAAEVPKPGETGNLENKTPAKKGAKIKEVEEDEKLIVESDEPPFKQVVKTRPVEEDFSVEFYPGAMVKDGYVTKLEAPGDKTIVQKTVVLNTVDSMKKVKDFYMDQFANPMSIDSGESETTITMSEQDQIKTDVTVTVTIRRLEEKGQTKIIISENSKS